MANNGIGGAESRCTILFGKKISSSLKNAVINNLGKKNSDDYWSQKTEFVSLDRRWSHLCFFFFPQCDTSCEQVLHVDGCT